MSTATRVSVITPAWLRHDLLLDRCIPSVQAQDHPWVEHVIVSDGPDGYLSRQLSMPWLDGLKDLWYRELPEHEDTPHYGHLARAYGLEIATGDYLAYCDDDDALRPEHCRLLATALDAHPAAGFAVSRMASHRRDGSIAVIGHGELACGNVGTPMIMHRRSVLEAASWDHAGQFEDWDLVFAWLRAGITAVRVDAETCDAWPSQWWGDSR
jgi:glycosyltransferase involved in cell wall biosynthesis